MFRFLKGRSRAISLADYGIEKRLVLAVAHRIFELPLAPLSEQRRIIGFLDDAFVGITTAQANASKSLENARTLFESYLEAAVSRGGDEERMKTVEELVSEGVLSKPFDGNHGEMHPCRQDYVKAGVPFVMASDLRDGRVDTERCKFLTRKLADSLRVGFAKNGDVLLSHKATIGRSAILTTDHDYVMLTPQVTAYRVKDKSRLSNRFLRYYFMSSAFQKEILAGAEAGSTRAYMGITKQLKLTLRIPTLQTQNSVVTQLDALTSETQRLESMYQRKLAALDELKKSLFHQAFTGQL